MTLETQISAYLDHLGVERGLAVNTISAYRRDLRRYQDYLRSHEISGAENVSASVINGFSQSLGEEDPPLATASVTRILIAVRSFHRFAQAEGFTHDDTASQVTLPKTPQRLPKALSIADTQKLMDTVDPNDPIGMRDSCLLELLYGTGARISEIVNLDVDDLTRVLLSADETVGVRLQGKGDKQRIVPLGSYARAAVTTWLEQGRPHLSAKRSPGPALLLNSRGNRLSRQTAWAVVKQRAEEAGLSQTISPHTLRHSYATHLLDGGADVRVVQELLGHASVTTTQLYTLVTVDHLREVFAAAHPRAY